MTNNINHPSIPLLLIGASGLIGSRICDLLKDSYRIETASSSTGVDITDPHTLNFIEGSEASFVILLAAKADVDGCEKDKDLGENGDAWKMNVNGAKNVAEVCNKSGKTLIYFSTDFVFDGTKNPAEKYDEEDIPNPINWYSQTKYEGEKAVLASGVRHIIFRTAYPYRAVFEGKQDFVRIIRSRLEKGEKVNAVTDHIMSPTFIDDIASALDALIANNSEGVFHVVGSEAITPYEAASAIATEYALDKSLIGKTTREEFFKGRAIRPFNLALKNDRIQRLGVRMHSFTQGLAIMHSQEKNI